MMPTGVISVSQGSFLTLRLPTQTFNFVTQHFCIMSNTETINDVSFNSATHHLLTDENFNLLCMAKKRIYERTGFSPSLKKLINAIINPESIDNTVTFIIETLK